MQEYSFVVDIKGRKLDMTKAEKAWYKVRHGKAKLLSTNPLTIQLLYEVNEEEINKDEIRMGVDIGLTTGIAIVQVCKTKTKVIFKGGIHHRQDIKRLMEMRREYRRSRRHYTLRYRKARFSNRGNSKREGRIPPTVKAHKDEILRVIRKLNKNIRIDSIYHEDVAFDIRALTEGYKPYRWQYQNSNRLDENIRKAIIYRDGTKCKRCGANKCVLEVHHIIPRRAGGGNIQGNLITLCGDCHKEVTGYELDYAQELRLLLQKPVNNSRMLKTDSIIQIGKKYLYGGYEEIGKLNKTNGGETANKRIDWGIVKTHSNDAAVITGCKVSNEDLGIVEYGIYPLRNKRKYNKAELQQTEYKHGDIVEYTNRKGVTHRCKIIAIIKSGIHKGKYKLKDIKTKERIGPIQTKSMRLITKRQQGIQFIKELKL